MPTTSATLDDVLSLLEHGAASRGEAVAIEIVPELAARGAMVGRSITHAGLHRLVRSLARRLRDRGVRGGRDAGRVAIVLPNGPDLSTTMLAASVAGVALPFNPAYRADEFEAYFRQSRAAILVAADDDAGPSPEVARRLGMRVVRLESDLAAGLDEEADAAFDADDPCPAPDDVALLLLTSGSTGRGKIVPLTHRNLCTAAADVGRSVALGPSDRVLSMWEQFHIGGVVDLLLAPLLAGGTVVSAGGFDAPRFFECLRGAEPTWFQGVPTTLRELSHHARSRGIDVSGSSLRFLRSVAAALPEEWRRELEDRFGVPVVQTFGMTEAAPLITSTRLPPCRRKPGSVGASCGPVVRIMDDLGRPLPPGATGQIAVRGANVFAGYEGDDEANAVAFRDGWFYTGDLGHLDADGELFLTGRVKELINRGGEKVTPKEVDDVLLAHPDVEEAAAFAIPHPTLGEDVAAAVVLRAGAAVDEAALRDHAAERLAAFKVPRHILLLDELPRCPVGKVRRRELAERFVRDARTSAAASPTTGLEAAIAALWAEELDLETIGVDDDFAVSGGDSLSSVRIVLAAERLVGRKIPDRMVGRFRTVRSMAAALLELGCPPEPPFAAEGPRGAADPQPTARDGLLDAVTAAMVGRDALPKRLLFDCPTLLAFDTARHIAENVSTPAELAVLMAAGGTWGLGTIVKAPLTGLAIARRRGAMTREFLETMRRADRPMLWRRESVAEHADLFRADALPAACKTLVVGFSSRAMRLTTPTYHILCALRPDRFDLLLLRDPGRRHYLHGVPGIGATVATAAEWLGRHARDAGYRRVVALGTSSGGMPAIAAAILQGWDAVLACGADRPSSHPHLLALLRECAIRPDTARSPAIKLAYSAHNDRDRAGADEIRHILPTATLAPDQRHKNHALLNELHRSGELSAFLTTHLEAEEP
jgi:acyl-CoA synthetase (AMP-forming)/AMP-acid ligase II/acyl carrier protein